ncbi:MAG: DUF427 domain-containing protein [Halanaerobiales bacterium]|nr:DUF427 domain-containing protein [Halanaerobiales bacterium]
MVKIFWQKKEIASSDDTKMVEGNHYFPPKDVNKEYLIKSDHHTTCPWKGEASYYHLKVDDKKASNAAWYYPEPKEEAEKIKDHVAFYTDKVNLVEY